MCSRARFCPDAKVHSLNSPALMACHSWGKFQGWSTFQVWDEDRGLEAFWERGGLEAFWGRGGWER